jgi:hypothetical protein
VIDLPAYEETDVELKAAVLQEEESNVDLRSSTSAVLQGANDRRLSTRRLSTIRRCVRPGHEVCSMLCALGRFLAYVPATWYFSEAMRPTPGWKRRAGC